MVFIIYAFEILVILICLLIATIVLEYITCLITKVDFEFFKPLMVANAITNPILNIILLGAGGLITKFILYAYEPLVYYALTIALEILVVYAEAGILTFYTGEKFKKTLKVSFKVNLVSFLFGLALSFIFDFRRLIFFTIY